MDKGNAVLRRYEDDLYISGTGVIVMGIWSIIKTVMGIFLEADSPIFAEIDDEFGKTMTIVITVLLLVIISALILKLHLYVGLNAMRASQGKTHKRGYLAVSVIMLMLTLVSVAAYKEKISDIGNIDTVIASMLVDLTTAYIFVLLIVSAYRIRKYKTEHMRSEQDHAA